MITFVFAYAPAGLGHLRVTDALYHGLSKDVTPLLLGSQDKSIGVLHRLTSIHPQVRKVAEWFQSGRGESVFAPLYKVFLRSRVEILYSQMETIIDQRLETPKTVLVVATHFGLAHQLAKIKDKIAQEKKIKLILVVQVTDDSPQQIWYIEGADLILVPSSRTKDELITYGKETKQTDVNFEVLPYPISPFLTESFDSRDYQMRRQQVEEEGRSNIHVAIPISGAAVGLDYFTKLIDSLYQTSQRFVFHVISKLSFYTQSFISDMSTRPFVNLHLSGIDREVVEKYEQVYRTNIISLEVTKPSEQAFKALIEPEMTGGSILLFSKPVGRQEYDNLDFLKRHNLIPNNDIQNYLFRRAKNELNASDHARVNTLQEARSWRGLKLPDDPVESANFINWCLKNKIFSQMMKCKILPRENDTHENELGSNGVKLFWEKVAELISG